MALLKVVVLSVALREIWCDQSFPPGFKFGVATSAYQIEGAWNVSGKGESIWDRFTHRKPNTIKDYTTGDIACDSYRLWKTDVQLISNLGVQFYRFSISWPRLLPTGIPNKINDEAVTYYSSLIDELLKNNIEPVITMYHWDLPQRLQDLGGWTNPLSAEWFGDYASVLYSLYADRVKTWITINEPVIMCDVAYDSGAYAPGIVDSEIATFLCNKHVLLAHATAYKIYDEKFRPKYQGQVSLTNHMFWYEPATEEDNELTDLVRDHGGGRFSYPIFSVIGGWPSKIKNFFEKQSEKFKFPRSRLPTFTQEEIEFLRGTYDFYGLNHYSSRVVRRAKVGELIGQWPLYGAPELGAILEGRPDWKSTGCDWLMIHPEGLRRHLTWVKEQYGNISILITENGLSTLDEDLDDYDRVEYHKEYLKQVLLAIKEDGVNVIGYTAWSLMDSFEWFDGYKPKFGLHKVDFTDPELKRTPRLSAKYYASIVKNRSLNVNFEAIKDEL